MTAPKATAFAMDTLSPIVGDLAIILAIPLAHQPSAVPFRAVLRDLERQISPPLVGFAALCKSRYPPPWPLNPRWRMAPFFVSMIRGSGSRHKGKLEYMYTRILRAKVSKVSVLCGEHRAL